MGDAAKSTTAWRRSLHVRLLGGTLVWIAVTLLAAGWGLAGLFGQHAARQFDAELTMHLDQLTAHVQIDAGTQVSLSAPLTDPRLARPYSGLYWQVDHLAGGGAEPRPGVLRSRSMWDAVLEVPSDELADGEIHIHRVAGPDANAVRLIERVVHPAEMPEISLRLIVAADERMLSDATASFSGMLALALGALGLGLGVAAFLQVAVGLRPLGALRRELAALREGRASSITGRFPSEIQPLVDDLNAVMARNAEIVARARTQAGNLAHALKTPFAVLANAADRDSGPLARVVTEQLSTALRQIDHHLARSRAAAATGVPGLRTPVRPVVESLTRVMQRVHAGRDLAFGLDSVEGDPAFRGEEQDLQEMLGNLLDNACKWASARVAVSVADTGSEIVVSIDDDGKGLPVAQREAVFERGVRADERVPGSGLGLAIVRELATLYGGDVRLAESALGGLHVELRLPRA